MNNICLLEGNPIENMENVVPIFVEGSTVTNPGYYANYSKVKSKSIK